MTGTFDKQPLSRRLSHAWEEGLTHNLNAKIEAQVRQIRISSLVWSCVTLGIAMLFFFLTLSGRNGDSLLDRTGAALLYRIRDLTPEEIQPTQKLKIFLFEDQTVGRTGTTELKLSQWDQVIRRVAERKPAAIYLDRVFSVISKEDRDSIHAGQFLRGVEIPVYSAAFVANSDLPGRSKIPPSELQTIDHTVAKHFGSEVKSYQYAYGAADFLSERLHPGHVVLHSEMNFLPLVRVEGSGLLPHLGIRSLVDDPAAIAQIPSRNGLTSIRYVSPKNLLGVSYPLHALIGEEPQNQIIHEGDQVLIVPAAYTGNVDYKDTPVGRVIGGYYVASILNSAITGNWLVDYGSGELGVHLLLVIGFLLGLLRGARGSLYAVMIGAAISAVAVVLFCFFETLIPWLQLSLSVSLAGTVVGSLKSREQAARAKLLTQVNAILSIDHQIESERKHLLLRERREAILVAQTFKPEPLPERIGHVSIYGFYESADDASGDWYFVRKSQSGDILHVLICDVVGHGMHAAMIVACCKATLGTFEKTVPRFLDSIDAMKMYLTTLNEVLYEQGQGQHCATVCSLSYNQSTGEGQLITCGHPPAIKIAETQPGDRKFSGISTKSDPVGLNPEMRLIPTTIPLTDGDSLLMYTDGLPVSSRFASFKRFARAAKLGKDFPTQITRHLWEQIFDRTGERCEDDISVILCVFDKETQRLAN